jgi:FKBP-type peptidyl-prolyl cis-trans isomerase
MSTAQRGHERALPRQTNTSPEEDVPSGLKIEDVAVGSGEIAERGKIVSIRWRGTLNRGDEFGAGEESFRVGKRDVIAGLETGVVGMRVGGVRRIRISPHLAYRDKGVPGIPAGAVLNFEIELLSVTA